MYSLNHCNAALGAEVTGIDTSRPLAKREVKALRKTWLERKVLVFRDQKLTPDQQLAFTRQFGDVDRYPFLDGIEGNPFVAPVLKLPEHTINFGGVWHSDTAYMETPAMGATLFAIEIPPVGGDTLFADMTLAYEALPDTVKQKILGALAVNRSDRAAVSRTRQPDEAGTEKNLPAKVFQSLHPVIRKHPETGKPVLYVNQAHTDKIETLSQTESNALLPLLHEQTRNPAFHYRVKWQPGTLVLWDNRSTQHYPLNDYPGHRRLLHRVSLKGDRPEVYREQGNILKKSKAAN